MSFLFYIILLFINVLFGYCNIVTLVMLFPLYCIYLLNDIIYIYIFINLTYYNNMVILMNKKYGGLLLILYNDDINLI